ncbi:DUF1702 family protein [Xylanibacillus composti]|uniref:DUF1702 family protein n=1 Tax=Xylanibacillus composti TaxID=1572762 RepID=A0A8J4H942_9BACL|nr:DUF1702 family protein [Xylanibacillus composti]MDT9726762.1 DUF1702 family protein [Xylanibacillus composti]GIQ71468.1 DUF1702 family protein [Xylanibacillus composti]
MQLLRMQWLHRNRAAMVRKIAVLNSSNQPFVQKFQTILSAFLDGYHAVLQNDPNVSEIKQMLDQRYDTYYRGFAYEGLGMGLGARTLFRPSEKASLEANFQAYSPNYLYQYYVGLGWWLSIRYGYRSSGYRRFLRMLDPFHGPIVYDGVGFRAGLLQRLSFARLARHFSRLGHVGERVCYQGWGRSLWFQQQFQLDKVLYELERLPTPQRTDAISGVGLAAAYSCFDDVPWVKGLSELVPREWRAAFGQGLSFGWQARKLQTPHFDEYVSGFVPAVSETVFVSQQAVESVKRQLFVRQANPRYVDWLDKVRQCMAEIL